MTDKSSRFAPIRGRYASVGEISEEFRALLERNVISLSNNDSYLMEYLMKSPAEVMVGTYTGQDRSVHLLKKTSWLYSVKEGNLKIRRRLEILEVPEISMRAAVMRLQKRLSKLTPYQVWSECKDGNLRVKKKGSDFLPKESVPFLVGLVDTRLPVEKGGR